jgi:hypothetical protein
MIEIEKIINTKYGFNKIKEFLRIVKIHNDDIPNIYLFFSGIGEISPDVVVNNNDNFIKNDLNIYIIFYLNIKCKLVLFHLVIE